MSANHSVLSRYPDYEATIGIEVHAQLQTNSKIFCSSLNCITQIPNNNICPICTGQPGVLPVLNEKVIKYAIKAGLATNCKIAPLAEFARKHYFYPDLPKNYQITQSTNPICIDGFVTITLEDGSNKDIRLIRIHMEEDAGKNTHSAYGNESFVDFNRAGTPLLEIVSQPDISNSYEAREYLKTLRLIVQYLGICSGNMEEGAFRADTNISVRKKGQKELGTRCELKNINSFKFISDAIEYEIERQIELLKSNQKVQQETRLWNVKKNQSEVMRSKEEAADYRYLDEPDLPKIEITVAMKNDIIYSMPELPHAKFQRLCAQGLTRYEADILINNIDIANYYEQATKFTSSKELINWILRDLMGLLKDQKITLSECKITPEKLAKLLQLLEKNIINNRAAQEVFALIAKTGKEPETIVEEQGLEQIGNTQELEAIVKEIISNNPKQVQEYQNGNQRLYGFFVGQVMQKTKGRGNPQIINQLLKKYL